jgi:hypothetical protein
MNPQREPSLSIHFDTTVIHWRGPAPYLFARVPDAHVVDVKYVARENSYGWGCVPVEATIGETTFTTSLFPRQGSYMLPVKVAVQEREQIGLGSEVAVSLRVFR